MPPNGQGARRDARVLRISVVLLALQASAWFVAAVGDSEPGSPAIWGTRRRQAADITARLRPWLLLASMALILTTFLANDHDVSPALGFTLSFGAAAWLVR